MTTKGDRAQAIRDAWYTSATSDAAEAISARIVVQARSVGEMRALYALIAAQRRARQERDAVAVYAE